MGGAFLRSNFPRSIVENSPNFFLSFPQKNFYRLAFDLHNSPLKDQIILITFF